MPPPGTRARPAGHRTVRCLMVWVGVTAAVWLGVIAIREEISAALTADWALLAFDAGLVRVSALAAAAAGAWIWLVTTVTVVEAACGLQRPASTSGPVRRLVLAACGVALVSGVGWAPAGAAPGWTDPAGAASPSVQGRLIGGLPLPDRASIDDSVRAAGAEPSARASSGPAHTRPVAHPAPHDTGSVVVLAGDSLWTVAAASLPRGAGAEQIERRWREIYAANRAVIGPDPDLIRPGLRLTLPPT